ncbi:carboxypeptidase [Rhizobium sp. BK376]|uniref:S10 family peptidase n=1 Tax=Rhizobium sp. BK376 TaxID=2512149 RepID=UPI00104F0685|nr:carboxypeptidase [Rhizobium sp. BK376]TCR75608.1 carboxypeptidase C (cathepsin A) [Rhizobium sp. BK376]
MSFSSRFARLLTLVLAIVSISASVFAEQPDQDQKTAPAEGVLTLLPPDAVSDHVLAVGGQTISYTATAGTLDLYGPDGAKTAEIFYTAYVAKDRGAARPITFAFNGGPGAASAFLNLGLVGPRVLDFGPSERDGANAKLVDNPDSWLRFTDLVLIDPIGTGWSRTAKPDDAKNFYSVHADAESLAKAIWLYVSHNGRSSSPKYLLGESYGGLRSVKIASALRQQQGILVSGIVMLSPLIDGSMVFGGDQSALGAALRLPSLVAADLERRNSFSEQAVEAAERFALTDYLTTLAAAPPSGDAAAAFYSKLSQMTGLPVEAVTRTRGFLGDSYVKNSTGGDGRIVSFYDAALVAPDPYPESASDRHDDPVLDGFVRAYGGAFSSYAHDELGFKTEMTYNLLAEDVNEHWNWSDRPDGKAGGRMEMGGTDDIRELLSLVPSFRLLVGQGYSDMVVPFAMNRYVLDHLPAEAAGRTAIKLYRGGHMFYTRPGSRAAFSDDVKDFYVATSVAPPAGSE